MRNLLVVLLMCLYCLGNVLLPNTDVAHINEMYRHCEEEDPDINAIDFVFEHLLNIPDIFECLEHGETEETEKPHEPTHVVSPSHIAVVITKPISFVCSPAFSCHPLAVHTMFVHQYFPSGFSSKILRPPIV